MKRVLWLALGLALGCGAPVLAQAIFPQGDFGGLGGIEWHSGCTKPDFPILADADEYQVEAAKTDFDLYQDCLRRRAAADSAYAANQVIEDAKKELREVDDDARAAGWRID